jgi:sulfate adenylyltransferase subunit 2
LGRRRAFEAAMSGLNHLDRLEAESIHIMRETVAEASRPVMLYSIGKDSAVMLHLARKAFHPAPLPFPLLHVDTTWKFRAMYALRDKVAGEAGIELIVHKNPEAEAKGINPFDHGPLHTDLWAIYNVLKSPGESMRVFPLSIWTEIDVWQ